MKKAIIAFGLPGAGKTTYSKSFAENNDYFRICPDDLAVSSQYPENIWTYVKKVIIDSLQKGQDIIVEAAAASYLKNRKQLIEFLRKERVEEIRGFYFPITLALARERNNRRDKPRPDITIEEMDKDLRDHPPTLEDGFDYFEIIEYK